MNPLYNIGIRLYKAAAHIAACRSPKIKEMLRGEAHTLATLRDERDRIAPEGYDVWFHAASLGEFEQGRPMIERLRREYPGIKILLTFFSPSGYTVRHNYDKVDTVAYLPLDTPSNARQFIDAAAPKMAIFIKYEFWGNYLETLHKKAIPTYIISAIFRPGQRFFRPGGSSWIKLLSWFKHIYVQDENSRKLLADIGINQVTVAGDTRFDRVTDIRNAAKNIPVLEKWLEKSPFTLVAGSTWPPDEELIFNWFGKGHNNDTRIIIAPHEFDKARAERIRQNLGENACLLSEIDPEKGISQQCRAIVIDCFGLLSSLYRYADTAYIGGGFGTGIHNINEAAVYGIPVIFGPKHAKFKEATDMIACGGGFEISRHDSQTFNPVLDRLMSDKHTRQIAGNAAGNYIASHIGATDIIFNDLFKKQ